MGGRLIFFLMCLEYRAELGNIKKNFFLGL